MMIFGTYLFLSLKLAFIFPPFQESCQERIEQFVIESQSRNYRGHGGLIRPKRFFALHKTPSRGIGKLLRVSLHWVSYLFNDTPLQKPAKTIDRARSSTRTSGFTRASPTNHDLQNARTSSKITFVLSPWHSLFITSRRRQIGAKLTP